MYVWLTTFRQVLQNINYSTVIKFMLKIDDVMCDYQKLLFNPVYNAIIT